MKIYSFICFYILALSCLSCQTKGVKLELSNESDTYHGITLIDPYRQIENLDDPQIKKWLEEQENHAKNSLHKIPKRSYLIEKQKEFEERNVVEISKLSITKNDIYFYLKSNAKENIAKLYFRNGLSGDEKVLFTPKDEYLINYIKPNWDGSKIVIGLTQNGEEISELFLIDVTTKTISKSITKNSWPSALGGVQWLPDNSGFTYVHLPITDNTSDQFLLNTKSVLFLIDTDKKDLVDIFSKQKNPNLDISKEDFPIVFIKDNEDKYVFGQIAGVSLYVDTYYSSNNFNDLSWKLLFPKEEKIKKFEIVNDSIIYLTSKNASNFEIRKTSILKPDFKHSSIVVKEFSKSVIEDFVLTSEGIFLSTTTNGVIAELYQSNTGQLKKLELPKTFGSLSLSAKSKKNKDFWITASGWTSTDNRYRFDHDSNSFVEENIVPVVSFPEFDDLEVEELLVKSHDGEEVPLSLVYKKGTKKNGNNPVILRGYGSYGYSMSPYFSPSILTWVLEGGIFATPHVRGGGEKGENWHTGGFKNTKPNTWKDLIACTEYLIHQKYSSKNKIAIWSSSAGGILVGRALTDRPDLFAVAIIESGSMNMIRSEIQPNGANNIKEFGTVKIKEEFNALLEMDSYHNIKSGISYPATLITAGINDPRVVAWDPAKFAARLQAENSSTKPILFSIDMKGGHGFDASKDKTYENRANVLSFALWQTGHPDYQPKE